MPDPLDNLHLPDLLAMALECRASDLHLKVGRPPVLRIDGELRLTDFEPLSAAEVRRLANEVMNERLRAEYEQTGGADFAFTLDSGDRFRINVYRERDMTSVAVRRVSRDIPDFARLHLPAETLGRICQATQGLVIFAGVTGCGKSTSIAACLDNINRHRRCHIVTIEDPIEFLFEDADSFVNQREIGTDVPTFELALKSLMREDPDVVLVGEMRDRETCATVLRAAETGHLVFTTLHASSAPGALLRLLDLFAAEEHDAIRQSLATNLVAVVCQKLVRGSRADARVVPATEVLLTAPTVRELIRRGEISHLSALIEAGATAGMYDFTQDLERLVREDWVEPKDAYEEAPNPEALKMALKGIAFRQGTLR